MKNYSIPTTTYETLYAGTIVCTSPNDGKAFVSGDPSDPSAGGKGNAPRRVGVLYL